MLGKFGKKLVLLTSDVDVNVNLDDLYGKLKEKTGVEDVGSTLKDDIISTSKWGMLVAGILGMGYGIAQLTRKHDRKYWWHIFFGY